MELSPGFVLAWVGAGAVSTALVLWGTVRLVRRLGRAANTRPLGR